MRNLVLGTLLTAVLFSFTACGYGKVNVKTDDFTNEKMVNLKLHHKSKETYFLLNYMMDVIYMKRVNAEGNLPLVLNYNLKNVPMSKPELNTEVVIRIGSDNYRLQVRDYLAKTITEISESSYDYDGDGSTLSADSYKAFSGKIYIDSDLQKKIIKADNFAVRMYLGADPVTFIISEKDLDLIKQVASEKM